jgi:hypothetical protein
MLSPKARFAACVGMLSTVLLANDALAMSDQECARLPGNQFLAAIERGNCRVDFETAAGPQETLVVGSNDEGGRDGRNGHQGGGRDGGSKGGGDSGGGDSGGGNNRAGAAAGKP